MKDATADISLDQIRIATPCPADWDMMQGDDRVRFCRECKLNVYNIAEMTRNEALELIRDNEGELCVRMYRRTDGTVITRDCPVGLRAAACRRLAKLLGSVAAVLTLAGSAFGIILGTRDKVTIPNGVTTLEPFATIQRWLDPVNPPPVAGGIAMGEMVMPPSTPTPPMKCGNE